MTVEQLGKEMKHPELVTWMALDQIRSEEREQAERQAKKGMKRTPRRRR